MSRGISLYIGVSYKTLDTYVDMQKDGSSGLSQLINIRNQINNSLDSDVKKTIIDALNKIEKDSSLKGSVESLKKNLKQVDSCLKHFPKYNRYYERYMNTSNEDVEERYRKKTKNELSSIESKL